MGTISDLISGAVEVTRATAETTIAETYSILAAFGVVIVLLFLLILFFVEPVMATILAVVLIIAVAYVFVGSDSEII